MEILQKIVILFLGGIVMSFLLAIIARITKRALDAAPTSLKNNLVLGLRP